MKRSSVVVRTRPRTMSGRRGGCVLTLDSLTAKDWIDRGWAVPVETEDGQKKVKTGK